MSDETEASPPPRPPPRWLKPAGLAGVCIAVLLVAGGLVSRGLANQKVARWTAETIVPTVNLVAPMAATAERRILLKSFMYDPSKSSKEGQWRRLGRGARYALPITSRPAPWPAHSH